MPDSTSAVPKWRALVARHLFTYLALLAGVVVAVSVVFARDELAAALEAFDARWVPVVLSLTLLNYGLRFLKWELLLRAASIEVPRAANARLYFACLAMVVTPARLGELYKLVFLRKLHGVAASRSLPPLVLERITDALAVLALAIVQPVEGPFALLAVLVAVVAIVVVADVLGRPAWRARVMGLLGALPGLRSRRARIDDLLTGHADLLHVRHFAPAMAFSVAAWWAECVGLVILVEALGSSLGLVDGTWIYALSTLLGNLTFLPGGLGGTEVSLLALLQSAGIDEAAAVAATALVRGATLWFAVVLGLLVTMIFRRKLRWDEVTAEAAAQD